MGENVEALRCCGGVVGHTWTCLTQAQRRGLSDEQIHTELDRMTGRPGFPPQLDEYVKEAIRRRGEDPSNRFGPTDDFNDYVAVARTDSARLSREAQLLPAALLRRIAERRIAAGYVAEEAKIRAELVKVVREAIYDTDRDRNPTLETAETGPQWSLEPDYRQADYTAMAQAAVDCFASFAAGLFDGQRDRANEATDVR